MPGSGLRMFEMRIGRSVGVIGLCLATMLSGLAFASDPDLLPDGAGAPDILLPEPPSVPAIGVAEIAPEPVSTGTVAEIVLPEPPPASVVVSVADVLPGAIETRLADPAFSWPKRLPKKDRDAIAAWYGARARAPAWVSANGWNRAARSLGDRLRRADEDALDPAEYRVPALGSGPVPLSPADLAEAEIKLSAASVLYGRDARGGRIDPARLSPLITPKLDLPGAEAVLASVAGISDPGAALARFNPVQPGYLGLKTKLAAIRANRPPSLAPVAARTRDITTQSIATLDEMPAPGPSGAFGNPRLEGDLVANMERWRWLPADMGSRYIFVNLPEFRLRLVEAGRIVHEARVITGRTETPTPILSGIMDHAVVNPSWYVPPSILKKEFLPRMAEDPGYAERQGYEVVRRGGAVSIRQPPGERNALGFIKFMFPNQHAVYLHDTPNRRLFSGSRRALSHGCVRVDQPFALADFVLGAAWSEARLKKLIGKGERTIHLPEKLPVHLAYFTLTVDEAGVIQGFEDIYGYNRKVRAALGFGA